MTNEKKDFTINGQLNRDCIRMALKCYASVLMDSLQFVLVTEETKNDIHAINQLHRNLVILEIQLAKGMEVIQEETRPIVSFALTTYANVLKETEKRSMGTAKFTNHWLRTRGLAIAINPPIYMNLQCVETILKYGLEHELNTAKEL